MQKLLDLEMRPPMFPFHPPMNKEILIDYMPRPTHSLKAMAYSCGMVRIISP
jgi:hypothetical protein